MFKKRTCLLHTLCFPFHEPEAEDSEDVGDGNVIGWKDPRSVNRRDTSQSEHQDYTVTPMRKGLFATAAGTTLKNTGLIMDYLYELINPACKGTVIFIILTPVSLVKKTCPGISGVPKSVLSCCLSHLSLPCSSFSPTAGLFSWFPNLEA